MGVMRVALTVGSAVAVLIALCTVLFLKPHDRTAWNQARKGKVFTPEQLAVYNGEGGKPYYLAVLGEVFDVTPGKRFYAKGEGYHHFVGRDGSRAFVTGDWDKDVHDDITDFDAEKCGGVMYWRGFFHNHTEYRYKGRVVGAFYTAAGQATPELRRVERLAKEAKSIEELLREEEAKHPRCNSRWNQQAGGFVWCDDGMHPRKITSQAAGKATSWCACFKEIGWSDVRQVYPGCEPEETECQTSPGEGQKPIPTIPPIGEELVWARPSPEELEEQRLLAEGWQEDSGAQLDEEGEQGGSFEWELGAEDGGQAEAGGEAHDRSEL